MKEEQTIPKTDKKSIDLKGFNKWLYGLFIVSGLYMFIFSDDFMGGVSNLGIALIFDPFNQSIKWKERQLYQKAVLVVHVMLVIGLLIYGLGFR